MINPIDLVVYGIEFGVILGLIFLIFGQGLRGAWHLITRL